MSVFLASMRVTVLGESTGQDEFGDPVDVYMAERQGIPAHVWENTTIAYEPSEGRVSSVHQLKGLVKDPTPLRVGERLKDEATGTIYIILKVNERHSVLGASLPQECELERVS